MGLVIWRLAKILTVIAILGGSAYYSLRTRVENEIGPWEQWVGIDPTQGEENPQKPKNLQGRFWTGVPRGGPADTGRIDRHGYSLGYSPSSNEASWAAMFLPGGKVSKDTSVARGIWRDDPELPSSGGRGEQGESTQLVPEWLMDSFYNYGNDTWHKSNKLRASIEIAEDWNSHLQVISDYATVYGGVVAFIGPYQGDGEPGFFSVTMRRGERGPEVLAFMLPKLADGRLGSGTVAVEKIEEATGLRFFADLPPEWRNYLRKKKPESIWAR